MGTKLKVAVLCQNDSFVIPNNIKLLTELNEIELVAVVNIKHAGSLENKKLLFLKGFGFIQTSKLGLIAFFDKVIDFIDMLFQYKLGLCKSLKSISTISKSKYLVIDNPNNKKFHKFIKVNKIDLIVSYSAPCIFYDDLLRIPPYGCINLHCSLLPKFPGQLPSFWALFNNEREIGSTVHYMDSKIDNGMILGQVTLKLPSPLTMFSVIKETKAAGGRLMVDVIRNLIKGDLTPKPNHVNNDTYYTWPTLNEIHKFRSNGGRLI